MKMDPVDKIISMISDVVVNTYNCGEPLFTNHSTSLSVDKEDVLEKVEQNISNPMSFRGFIKRMQTYNIVCWYAHRWLALQLARRGWENVKECVIKCCFCAAESDLGAHLISTLEEDLLKKLSERHASFCRWQTLTSPEFFACVPYVQSSQGLKITVTRIASLLLELGQDLPKIPEIVLHKMKLDSKTLELLICDLLKDVSVSDASVSAVVLTLCGWSPASTTGVLCCCYCDRRIALRHWMSVQEFNEQRCLVLNDDDNMKICSTLYMQSSFAKGADKEEEGSQSPLSDQSIITEHTDEEEEVEEEEEEYEGEEMEVEDYEDYEKETERQYCVSADNDELSDDNSSKINNGQNKFGKFDSHDDDDDEDDVEMEEEERYDKLGEQDLKENNYNEQDNINEDTEDEMQHNEEGPSDDEDIKEAEISDGSLSDNVELKSGKLKGPRKQTQYKSNDDKQNYGNSSAVKKQCYSCANEYDIESSEEDDVNEENEAEEEDVEEEEDEEEEDDEIEHEVEEIGDEEDDEDYGDDEDDEEEEEEDGNDEEDEEMLGNCNSQENDSDKVIELSDSDDEITPQPKETTHTFPNPASALVGKKQTVVKGDEILKGNEHRNCEKLMNEVEAEFEVEAQKSNDDSILSEDVEMQSQCSSDPGQPLNCENQDTNTVPLAEEINSEDDTFKGESRDVSKVIDQQGKCTLKRKRDYDTADDDTADDDDDDGDDDDDDDDDENVQQLGKKKQPSPDESELNGSGKVIIDSDSEDDKSNLSEGESICSEAPDKNVETSSSTASSDDDGDDDRKLAACEISMVQQIVECEDKHSNSPNVSETKFDCVVRSSEGGESTPDTKSLDQSDVESTGTPHLTPLVSETVSKAPAGAEEGPVPSPATSTSEVDSEMVSESDAVIFCNTKSPLPEQSGNTVEKSSICMPVLSLEVQPVDGHVSVRKSNGVMDDTVGNMPILVREDTLGDVGQEQPEAVSRNNGKHETLAAVQVVQTENSEGVQVQISEEVHNNGQVKPSQQPPGAKEVLAASEKIQSSSGKNGSKEDRSISDVSCLIESNSVQNAKSRESEPVLQITEDIKGTATIDNIDAVTTGRLLGVSACLHEPMEENALSKTSTPEVLDNNEAKCATGNREGSVNEDGVAEICEVEDANACAEQDEVSVHEAMDVGKEGEQMVKRGVKRDRDSDSEQSLPAKKRPHKSPKVRKLVPLLDPTSEHRFWCLWSASTSTSSYRHKSGCEIVFQEILEKIVQQREDQDYMDIAGKLRYTQEQITPL